MGEIRMSIGRSDFADIRRSGCYYVDKSGLIRAILSGADIQAILFTRPAVL